jgi:hypothetical protein
MSERICLEPDCGRAVQARDRCHKHYVQWYRDGGSETIVRRTFEERFWSYVRPAEALECWEWTGARNQFGYGQIGRGRDNLLVAHRASWEMLRGEIPDGLQLDHLCRNPPCVNPWHLDPVTQRVNLLRGETLTARNAAKTECPSGHPYTPGNIYWDQGHRTCRTCKMARSRAAHAAKRRAIR